MKWIETKVVFDSNDNQFATDLISNLFYDLGLHGVVMEDPEDEPEEGWGDGAQQKPDHYSVAGYFPDNEPLEKRFKILEEKLTRLRKENGILSRIEFRKIDEQDWAESWKAYFRPQKISEKIVVKPTWREYDHKQGEIVLEIDPGMAFGTGTHPTTDLCINMIEKYIKTGYSFLDIGTGSGILMLSAAKLGAKKVWGIDNDTVAVKIAEKNLLQNRIDPAEFKILSGSLVDVVEEQFDLVVANILSEVIIVLLDSIKKVLNENGIFICSGVIEEKKDTVVNNIKRQGFEIMEIRTKDRWVAIAMSI